MTILVGFLFLGPVMFLSATNEIVGKCETTRRYKKDCTSQVDIKFGGLSIICFTNHKKIVRCAETHITSIISFMYVQPAAIFFYSVAKVLTGCKDFLPPKTLLSVKNLLLHFSCETRSSENILWNIDRRFSWWKKTDRMRLTVALAKLSRDVIIHNAHLPSVEHSRH